MFIDIHTHIIPEQLPQFAARKGNVPHLALEHSTNCNGHRCARIMQDGALFREIQANCWDPAVRLQECDRAGINIQVLSTIPVLFSYWSDPSFGLSISQYLNDHIAKVVSDYPGRFLGLGTIPMQAPELAAKEMQRCKRELGFSGIEIGTNVNGDNLDSPSLEPIWAAAQDLDLAVFVHPWEMAGGDRMQRYFLRWLVGMPAETALAICSLMFGGVFDRFPKVRFAFSHGGGSFPLTLGRIAHGFIARPDLCAININTNPSDYIRKFYIDSLVHDPATLAYLIKLMGVERIACGSDYPFPLGEDPPGAVFNAMNDLTQDELERLRSGTALEWLGLDSGAVIR